MFSSPGSYGNIDTIDPGSRNIHLSIPLFSKRGKAGEGWTLTVEYDNSIWTLQSPASPFSNIIPSGPNWGWKVGAVSLAGSIHFSGGTRSDVGMGCNNSSQYIADGWYYIDPKGGHHDFWSSYATPRYDGVASPTCGGMPANGKLISKDNSGYVLTLTNVSPYLVSLVDRSGNAIAASLVNDYDSTTNTSVYDHSVPDTGAITDVNANQLTYSGTAIIDSTGIQVVQVSPKQFINGILQQSFTYTAWDGSQSTATVSYSNFTVATNFGLSGLGFKYVDYPPTSAQLVTSIALPDGTSYSFQYEPTANEPGYVTGRVSSVTLPSGGVIQYVYGIMCCSAAGTFDPTSSDFTRISPDGSQTYGLSKYLSSTKTLIDSNGNETDYQTGYNIPIVSQVLTYNGLVTQTSTPIKVVTHCWSGSTTAGPCSIAGVWGEMAYCLPPQAQLGSCPPAGTYNLPPAAITDTLTLNGVVQSQVYTVYNSVQSPVSISEYDGSGNLLRKKTIQYAALAGNILDKPSLITITDGTGALVRKETITYDVHGNALSVTESGSSGSPVTESFTYTSNGQLSTATDRNNNQTTYTYSDCNNSYVTSINKPLGLSRGMHWDCNGGVLLSSSDYNGQLVTYKYDPMWRLKEVDNPDGGVSTSTYNVNVIPQSVVHSIQKDTAGNQEITQTFFDWADRPTTDVVITDPISPVYRDTTYDSLGRKASASNPYRSTSESTYGVTSFSYDPLGRPQYQCQPDNSTAASKTCTPSKSYIQSTYFGLTHDTYDELQNHWKYTYDSLDRLTSVLEPNGSSKEPSMETDYTYDVQGNLTSVNQQGSSPAYARARQFSYDYLSRLLTAQNPETGTVAYTYDNNGNVLNKSDSRISLSYCYDALNRVLGKKYSAAVDCTNPSTWDVGYTYDVDNGLPGGYPLGRLTGVTDSSGMTSWQYDKMGRVEQLHRVINGLVKDIYYTYQLDGKVSTITYPSGHTLQYLYNNVGQVTSATWVISGAIQTIYFENGTYSPSGALVQYSYGPARCFTGIVANRTYNNRLQPVTLTAATPGYTPTEVPPKTVYSLTYDFHNGSGDNGNLYAVQDNIDTQNISGRPIGSSNYTYDTLNRITSAQTTGTDCTVTPSGQTMNWGQAFTIDDWGNLISVNVSKCSATTLNIAITPKNQLSGSGLYDGSGNYTNNTQYGYDVENRLTTLNGTTAYIYNGLGERVRKIGQRLYWFGADGSLLAESTESGTITTEYIYVDGERIAAQDINSDGSAGPVHYYYSDSLGTTQVITDAFGATEMFSQYFPYGGERSITPWSPTMLGASSQASHYKYTGKERDTESGNDYFGARYYGSNMGRFMSPDPLPWIHWQNGNRDDQQRFAAYISNPQNFNMYSYVLNNPLNKTDPTGMNACGTKDDSSCKVTITITNRSTDKNGKYNDQFKGVANQANYNATAVVNVNGKDAGTFLIKTTPSDSNSGAPLAAGVYSGTLTTHSGSLAIRIQPTTDLPTAGPNPGQHGAWFAQGDLIHKAGVGNFTGVGRDGRAVSNGCLVVCTSQFGDFEGATGMSATPPQRHFTIDVDSTVNQKYADPVLGPPQG